MDPPVYNLLHTRVRYEGDGLGSEAGGWIAAEDADNFDVDWGKVFRIRARLTESGGDGTNANFKWQFNRESAGWVDVNPHDHATVITSVVAVPSENYADGDAISTELLTSGGGTFINGVGDENNAFPSTVDLEETEIETAFMFMNYYDGAAKNSDADSFEFRIIESDGTVFTGTEVTVTITLNTVDNFIGSTYPETSGRNLVADGNKNLYTLMDITEGNPQVGMLKSSDGGKTWILQDHANRPAPEDAEAVDLLLVGDTIFIAYVERGDDIHHFTFDVSTHATNADKWDLDQEPTPAVSKNDNPQTCAIEIFGNGDKVIFYMADNGSIDSGYYKIDTGSGWGSELTLDAEASHFCKGITAVIDTNNLVHIFYKMLQDGVEGILYHKSLSEGGTLSGREAVDTTTGTDIADQTHWFVMVAPPVAWQDGSNHNVMVVYRDTDNKLYSSVVTNDGSPGTPKEASDTTVKASPANTDSGQPVAALAIDGDVIYLHYADLTSGDLFRAKNTNNGTWGTDTEEIDGTDLFFIRSRVFTHSGGNGGAKVVGYTYEKHLADEGGYTGFTWYGEFEISAGGVVVNLGVGALAANGQALSVVPGAVTISLGVGSLSANGQALSVVPGPAVISLAVGSLAANGQALTVIPGQVAISLAVGALGANGQTLAVVPGAVAISLAVGSLTANGQALTVNTFTTINLAVGQLAANGQTLNVIPGPVAISLGVGSLSANGQALTVIPGQVTISLAVGSLSANGQTLTVSTATTINLGVGSLAANGQALQVIPGPVAISLAVGQLAANGQTLNVKNNQVISLAVGALTANGQTLAVVPGTATVSLAVGQLAANGQQLFVITGQVLVQLGVGVLNANGQALAVVPGPVAIGLGVGSLAANGQTLDVIPGPAIISLAVGVLNANGQTLIVDAGEGGRVINLGVGQLAANGQALAVVPGPVAISLGVGALTANGQSLAVTVGVIISLGVGSLSASGQALAVLPGQVAISLGVGSLAASGQVLSVVPGPVTITMGVGILNANGQRLVVVSEINADPNKVAYSRYSERRQFSKVKKRTQFSMVKKRTQ